jgi:hypothetical protein
MVKSKGHIMILERDEWSENWKEIFSYFHMLDEDKQREALTALLDTLDDDEIVNWIKDNMGVNVQWI